MSIRRLKNFLNAFYARHVGGERRPTFFDIDQVCPALNEITAHYPVVKREFEQVCGKVSHLPRYHEIDPGEGEISGTTQGAWRVFMLYLLGNVPRQARQLCPETCRLVEGVPGLVQAFFSILEPGKVVPLHRGPYLGYLRYHLGLQIPREEPPRIVVNGQPYQWREGEAVMFDDSWPHEVRNDSEGLRAVLIVDVLRPMPAWPALVNRFATNVIARYTYGRDVMRRMGERATIDRPPIE